MCGTHRSLLGPVFCARNCLRVSLWPPPLTAAAHCSCSQAVASLDGLCRLFSLPMLGRLSDSVGRKPLLLLSLCSSAVTFTLYAVLPSPATVVVGHLINGLTQCTLPVLFASVAEASAASTGGGDGDDGGDGGAAELRNSFGLMGVAFGLAFTLGPGIGGALAGGSDSVGFEGVFLISAALFLAAAAFCAAVVPETNPSSHGRRAFVLREGTPWHAARLLLAPKFRLLCAGLLCEPADSDPNTHSGAESRHLRAASTKEKARSALLLSGQARDRWRQEQYNSNPNTNPNSAATVRAGS